MVRICEDCVYVVTNIKEFPCSKCVDHSNWKSNKTLDLNQTVSFHRLNGLTPTIESCTMKMIEELGEAMQLIGKGQGKNGERQKDVCGLIWASRLIEESLDTAQSAATMVFTLCEEYGFDINEMIKNHEEKLKQKGYLV